MNKQKVGRPFKYCRDIVLLAAVLLYLKSLSYRRLTIELFLVSGIEISKSQLQERITGLFIEIEIDYVDFIKKQGYPAWSRKFKNGKRWLIETVFSKFKRLF